MFAMKVTLALLSKYGSIGVRGCLGAFRVAGRNPQFAIRNSKLQQLRIQAEFTVYQKWIEEVAFAWRESILGYLLAYLLEVIFNVAA
jgi:hypothetical protein